MYLGYQEGKIKFYTEEILDVDAHGIDRIEETEDEYIIDGDQYVLKTQEVIDKQAKEARIQEIYARLTEIDNKSIRAIRANDTDYIDMYEQEAIALREELRSLQ